ncbi:MAG: hypothetical protein GKR89_23765 [Candidatus Latescibacteria bacterium]|nr:hypothetical protein [Candidatus Latescibacterota bacterium]
MPPLRTDSTESASGDLHVTVRGIAIGSLLCVAIALGAPYGRQVIKGTSLALTSATPAAFFLFLLLLLTLHLALGWWRRSWALRRGELITVFIMMAVASAIPTKGVNGLLLPMITGTFYYATPENDWANQIHPLLPHGILVTDARAVKEFYEGASGQGGIPWAHWLAPLGAWLLLYGSLYLALTSIAVVLRRQWAQHERLIYPLMQVPLAMMADDEQGRLLKPFFRSGIMWTGFAIPVVFMSLYALHNYFPWFPQIVLSAPITLFGDSLTLTFGLNFLMLGFGYFINTQMAFSLWAFYLLHQLQEGLMLHYSLHSTQAQLGWWSEPGMGHQMMGALIVLVVSGLWVGRRHFGRVLHKAWRGDAPVDDSDEIMSYRAAVCGLLIGLGGMWVWLWQSGIPAVIVPLFLFAALVIFIGLARVIAETGLPIFKANMIPAGFAVSSVGVPALGLKGMVATGYTMVWCGDLLVFMMAPLANGLRLGGELRSGQRRLAWAVGLAMLIALVLSAWFTIYLAYRYGSMNLLISQHYAAEPSRFALEKIANPSGPSLSGYLWMGGGGLVMGLLLLARQQLWWWPLHPLGFLVSHGKVMNGIWATILLAWLCKTLVLKYGGVGLYRRTQPFFLGLALGHIAIGGIWLIIDGFTGMVGNRIPLYY